MGPSTSVAERKRATKFVSAWPRVIGGEKAYSHPRTCWKIADGRQRATGLSGGEAPGCSAGTVGAQDVCRQRHRVYRGNVQRYDGCLDSRCESYVSLGLMYTALADGRLTGSEEEREGEEEGRAERPARHGGGSTAGVRGWLGGTRSWVFYKIERRKATGASRKAQVC